VLSFSHIGFVVDRIGCCVPRGKPCSVSTTGWSGVCGGPPAARFPFFKVGKMRVRINAKTAESPGPDLPEGQ
jgi:hypothetical protein